MDAVNVIASERLKELSAINNTLYEFLLADEQKSGEEKVVRHVILKADIRDSTTLTRTLYERGLNPASYFSLNFYEPINKLLPKYDASTVFIEGDAVKDRDYSEATVVFLYMGNEFNNLLRPILEKQLKPGTRIVSHRFVLGDWKPDETKKVVGQDGDEYLLHIWTVKKK